MNIRLYNARILTLRDATAVKEENEIAYDEIAYDIYRGEVWISGERIVFAGKETEAKPDAIYLWDREIDLHGNLIMPGLKNAHTHSPMSGLRSLADDLTLDTWLNEKIFPHEAKMTEEDMHWFTRLSLLEYLNSGVTQIFDMYFAAEAVADVCRENRFPLTMCGAVNDFVQSVPIMEELYHRYNRPEEEYIRYKLGFHAQYTTNDMLLHEIAELAHSLHEPVSMHINETEAEIKKCFAQYGCSPFEYLNNMKMFEYGGTGFHCVHMSDRDVEIMREHGMTAVTNPSSNLKLASGIADIARLMKAGIPVAIGTDGPASNNCLSMFKEMFHVASLSKVRAQDASCVPAKAVLYMATEGGCDAMFSEENRAVRTGDYADICVIDLNRPNMQPIPEDAVIIANLVYSAGRDNVDMTIVRGNILYEKGEYHLAYSTAEIYDRCNEITHRIVG